MYTGFINHVRVLHDAELKYFDLSSISSTQLDKHSVCQTTMCLSTAHLPAQDSRQRLEPPAAPAYLANVCQGMHFALMALMT